MRKIKKGVIRAREQKLSSSGICWKIELLEDINGRENEINFLCCMFLPLFSHCVSGFQVYNIHILSVATSSNRIRRIFGESSAKCRMN